MTLFRKRDCASPFWQQTRLIALTVALAGVTSAAAVASPQSVELAAGGDARLPVVIAEDASELVRQTADDLAAYLGRISGGTFEVTRGDGRTGIAVGPLADFPALKEELASKLDATGLARRDQYLLQSHDAGVYVIGVTERGARHSVWDLLHRLGFRRFFANERWEVVPSNPDLALAVAVVEAPDYYRRNIWYTGSTYDYRRQNHPEWLDRNRGPGDFELQTGHAWGGIYRRHREVFEQHPEWLALYDGERIPRGRHEVPDAETGRGTKFCISNKALREFIVQDRLEQMDPDADMISVDPSDYAGWCECDECAKIGSPSNQVVTLANEVAEAIVAEYGEDKYVGMYAYNRHSQPPTIDIHSNVVVNVATMFIRDGYTPEQLVEGWAERGAIIGMREYYARLPTSFDLPGRTPASDIDFLAQTIPAYYKMGARFMHAQAMDSWGSSGLGYYLAMRMLWDVSEAERIDELIDDFLHHAFGDAREPMGQFYKLTMVRNDEPVLLSEHTVGQMYRLLNEALQATDDPAVHERIHDLVLYTRFVELYRAYDAAAGDERAERLGALLRHNDRMRYRNLVHVQSHYSFLAGRVAEVDVPDDADFNTPAPENPWKSEQTDYDESEIITMLREGIGANALRGFEPVTYSRNLRPAAAVLDLPSVGAVEHPVTRYDLSYYTWIDEPSTVQVEVTGGLIVEDRTRGDVEVNLRSPGEDADGEVVAAVPPNGRTRALALSAEKAGLYHLNISDGGDKSRLRWHPEQPMTLELAATTGPRDFPHHFDDQTTLYFYVPRGTEVVAGHHVGGGATYGASGPRRHQTWEFARPSQRGTGIIYDADGEAVHTLPGHDEEFSIPVPEGQDGRVWRVQFRGTPPRFMTVPPYAALTPRGLMLPAEVLEAEQSDQ